MFRRTLTKEEQKNKLLDNLRENIINCENILSNNKNALMISANGVLRSEFDEKITGNLLTSYESILDKMGEIKLTLQDFPK